MLKSVSVQHSIYEISVFELSSSLRQLVVVASLT